MAVVCLKTSAHCPMMRRAYQNWVKPRLAGAHSSALSLVEQGRTSVFLRQYIGGQELSVVAKAELLEAAFLFQSDRTVYFRELALTYARMGDFKSANVLIATIPINERMTDNKILKVYLLQALASEKEIVKAKVASMAKQARRIWDDETAFLIASLAVQTGDFKRAHALYGREFNAGPERRSGYFYQIMILIALDSMGWKKKHKGEARKMLIEGQAKLPRDFLDEQCNVLARKYFRLHIPGQAECLLELFEKIPDVKWKDDVLAKISELTSR